MWIFSLIAALAAPPTECPPVLVEPGFHPDRADQVALALVDQVDVESGQATVNVLHAMKGSVPPDLVLPPPRSCEDLWPLHAGDLVVLVLSAGHPKVALGSRTLVEDSLPFPFLGPGEPLTEAVWDAAVSQELIQLPDSFPVVLVDPVSEPTRRRIDGKRRDVVPAPTSSAYSLQAHGGLYGDIAVTRTLGRRPHPGCIFASSLSIWDTAARDPTLLWSRPVPVIEPAICGLFILPAQ